MGTPCGKGKDMRKTHGKILFHNKERSNNLIGTNGKETH